MWRNYDVSIYVTDPTPGGKLGARVLPRRYVVKFQKPVWIDLTVRPWRTIGEITPGEMAARNEAISRDPKTFRDAPEKTATLMDWLELEIASDPSGPPRCIALRAPNGIFTEEQRFPIASWVAEASARVASRNPNLLGTWTDTPQGIELEDMLFEANRARGRRRGRSAVTTDRLEDVARIARQYPRTPTAAVQNHFRISRGYARRLIKQAETAGLEIVGKGD